MTATEVKMEFTGKTVEEAIEAGLKHFGVEREDAEIQVISEEVKGLFGKVKKEAVVTVQKKQVGAERAVSFLEGVLEKLGIEAKAILNENEENTVINIITTSSSAVIGYRGEVLDSLQSLAGAVANIGNSTYKRVVVDCEDYRAKREGTLVNLANKLADKAVRQGRDVFLEPMNPYERRVIHSTLASSETVTTSSEGKEPNRHVVIIPNEKKPYVKRESDGRYDNRRGGYNNNRGGDRNGRPRNDGNRGYGANRSGDRNDRPRREGGFSSAPREPKHQPATFGTYLGNSLKNED